jgi:hypothetical protein
VADNRTRQGGRGGGNFADAQAFHNAAVYPGPIMKFTARFQADRAAPLGRNYRTNYDSRLQAGVAVGRCAPTSK